METIKLGKHEEIPVYAQKWAYLANRTSKSIMGVLDSGRYLDQDAGSEDGDLGLTILEWAGSSAYELLVALIPTVAKRMPEYEFAGYGSKEAYDNQEYDEESDDSPTLPEIVNAFEVAIRVNRFDLAKVLGNIIDPKELRGPITQRLASAISKGSENSQQQNGEFQLTNSSQKNPTSKESMGSHSPDSTSSLEST